MARLRGKAKRDFLERMRKGRERAAAARGANPKRVTKRDVDAAAAAWHNARTRYGENNRATDRARWRYDELVEQWERQRSKRRKPNPELMVIHNPTRQAELGRAVRQYRKFHGTDPAKALRRGRGRNPKVLVGLGDVVEIVYEPRRGQRKRIHWVHRFKRRAILATDEKGRGLYIVDPEGRVMVDFSAGLVS